MAKSPPRETCCRSDQPRGSTFLEKSRTSSFGTNQHNHTKFTRNSTMAEGRAFAGFSERGNTILRAMHQPNFCTSKTEQHRSQIHLQSQKTQQILVASKISNGDLDNDRPYDSDQRSSDQDRSQISLLPPGSLGDAVAFSVFPSERENLRAYSNEHGKRLLPLPVFKSDSPDGRVLEEPRDSDIDVRGRYSSHGTATSHRAPSRNRAQETSKHSDG